MIFASVVLALLADDWRAGRVDRAEEREFLALLASDLAADADGFRVYRERLDGQEQAAQRLVGLLEAGAPAESVVIALRGATQLYNFRPSGSAFRALTSSGRLYLIRDVELRDTITTYHVVRPGRPVRVARDRL